MQPKYHVFTNPVSVLWASHLAVPKPLFALQPEEGVGMEYRVGRSLREWQGVIQKNLAHACLVWLLTRFNFK